MGTPDSLHVLTTQEDGSSGIYRLSAVLWHEQSLSATLYGSEGTLIYDFKRDEIRGGRRSDKSMHAMPIPDDLRGGWRVEDDFVASIRGEHPVTHTAFRHRRSLHAIHRGRLPEVPDIKSPSTSHSSSSQTPVCEPL